MIICICGQCTLATLPAVLSCSTNTTGGTLQAKRKRNNMGDMKIVVAGCVAQQEGATLLRRVPEVDLVMGPQFANRSPPLHASRSYIFQGLTSAVPLSAYAVNLDL